MDEHSMQNSEALFMGLISMLSQGVMLHLGKIADPITQKVEKNMEAAKGTIDLILALKEKTKGNLNAQEERFLNNMITNLQLNYVEESEASQKGAAS
jgi:hypothetical protein